MTIETALTKTLDRIGDVAIARPAQHLAQRLDTRSTVQSAAAQAAATAALLNATLLEFTRCVYEPAPGSMVPAGIDRGDWRLLLTAPWSNHYQDWGLRRYEQRMLRMYLFAWQERPARPPVFVFSQDTLRWHANLTDYPTFRAAGAAVKDVIPAAAVVDYRAELRAEQRVRLARKRTK